MKGKMLKSHYKQGRHAELDSASRRLKAERFQIKFGMTTLYNNGGFTLIELLVVVLIIGILAAVALPQYQKAVEKSRAAEGLVIIKTLAQAEQVYYLANGDYSYDINLLDVDIPGTATTLGVSNAIKTRYFTCRASSTSASALWKDALAVCARKEGAEVDSVYSLASTKDGNNYCVYYSAFGEQICKSFGKEKVPEIRENTYRI